jgi:hypothetical protein
MATTLPGQVAMDGMPGHVDAGVAEFFEELDLGPEEELEEDRDDFDPDFEHPGQWVSKEQEIEMYTMPFDDYPKVSDWKDIEMDGNVDISIDLARKDLHKMLNKEIECLRIGLNLTDQLKVDDAMPVAMEKVFGQQSPIYLLFAKRLEWSYDYFLAFMATLCQQCTYHASSAEIFSDTTDINMDGLLDKEKYFKGWEELKTCGIGEGRKVRPLWIDVEMASNDTYSDIFVNHISDTMDILIALDDDKATFAAKPGARTDCFLKLVHHASDKRMGFTCHTAAATCSGIPVRIRWEREGDTTTTVYSTMVQETFGAGQGINEIDLSGIIFASDRGYWTQMLLFGLLLKCGTCSFYCFY